MKNKRVLFGAFLVGVLVFSARRLQSLYDLELFGDYIDIAFIGFVSALIALFISARVFPEAVMTDSETPDPEST